MKRKRLDNWCERAIAVLVIVILVFAALATGAVRTLEYLVVQGLTMGVLILWLIRLWGNNRPRLFWPPICWPVLGFTLYAVARYATADIEYVARLEMIRVLVYTALFFAILNNLKRQKIITRIVRVMVFLGMGVAGYAVYQYFTGDNHVWHFISPYVKRGSGTFINPNHMAGFLELILPVGLAYVMIGRARKPLMKIAMAYSILVIVAGIALSFSRGGWISTGLSLTALCILALFQRRSRWPALATLVVLVALGVTFFTQNLSGQLRLARAFTGQTVNTELRSALWRPAMEMWQENIWFGVGPAHYDYRFREYRPATVQARPDRAHNDYVNTLTDWGIVGTVLVVSAWMLLYWGAFRTWRRLDRGGDFLVEGSDRMAFMLGSSTGLFAILVHSLVDFNMHVPSNALLVITWMALLSTQLRYTSQRSSVKSVMLARGASTVLILLCLTYLGWQLRIRAVEYLWLERARQEAPGSLEQAGVLESAFATDPMNFETANAIGEIHRSHSWEGRADYASHAETALIWFERAMLLNPYDEYSTLRFAMCLDWLGRPAEAEPYYNRADKLDPRGYYTAANIGWHYMKMRNYPAAQAWFERSLRLQWEDNPISTSYLQIIRERMLDAASNPLAMPLLMEESHSGTAEDRTKDDAE